MTTTDAEEYDALRRDVLSPVADKLADLIRDHLRDVRHIDRVSARAKDTERYRAKALKVNEDGSLKYNDPLHQIQDLIGVRVTVLFLSDVEVVSRTLKRYFRHIEEQVKFPEHEWEFGYFGKHFVFALPSEAIPSEVPIEGAVEFFELQIKTLFQHAWSEANHDLGYKPRDQLTVDQQRLLAYASAQAWGADRVFDELASTLS